MKGVRAEVRFEIKTNDTALPPSRAPGTAKHFSCCAVYLMAALHLTTPCGLGLGKLFLGRGNQDSDVTKQEESQGKHLNKIVLFVAETKTMHTKATELLLPLLPAWVT